MAKRKREPATATLPAAPPMRGGSASAKRKGLVGIVAYVTPAERQAIGLAAARARQPVNAWARATLVEGAQKES